MRIVSNCNGNTSAPRRVAFAGAGGHKEGELSLHIQAGLLIPPALVAEHAPARQDGRYRYHAVTAYQTDIPDFYVKTPGILFALPELKIVCREFAAWPCLWVQRSWTKKSKSTPLRGKPASGRFTTARENPVLKQQQLHTTDQPAPLTVYRARGCDTAG